MTLEVISKAEKLKRVRVPRAFRRSVEIRARPLQAKMNLYLIKLARREVKRAIREGKLNKRVRVRKSDKVVILKVLSKDTLELAEIFRVFGLRRINRSGQNTVKATQGTWQIPPEVEREFLRLKDIKVKEFLRNTNVMFADSIRAVLLEVQSEIPRPSVTEISRRLFQRVTSEGPMSPGRAERIARTETAQSENTGIAAGYTVAGIKEMRWVAAMDSRTRSSHRRLHGTTTKIGTPFKFRGEGGGTVRLRYPADPLGSPADVINCRCTTIPVIPK